MESWISIPSSKHNNQVLIHIFQIIFRRGKPDYWEIRTEACGFLWYFLSPSETLGCRYSSLSWCSSISHVGHASANDGWKHLVCWNVLWSASLWLSLLQMCSLNNWASLEDGGWLSWLLMLFAHHTFSHLSIFHWKEPWYGGDGSNEGCSVGTDFKQLISSQLNGLPVSTDRNSFSVACDMGHTFASYPTLWRIPAVCFMKELEAWRKVILFLVVLGTEPWALR